ncbi:hypothetical protein ACLBPW_31000, partial [Klebsiella pneumoniae]|uniref:hypothetical protein n=1 Tax=Klebsiella pneumoniae TaxID=573 RepID=UPI00396952BC
RGNGGTSSVSGQVVDIFSRESDVMALRVELFDEEVERLSLFDPLTGHVESVIQRFTIYPKTLSQRALHVIAHI